MENPITIKEFIKLPEAEKTERYKDMSDHDRFLWRTQYAATPPTVVGHFEMTDEEKQKAEQDMNNILRRIGVLKD